MEYTSRFSEPALVKADMFLYHLYKVDTEQAPLEVDALTALTESTHIRDLIIKMALDCRNDDDGYGGCDCVGRLVRLSTDWAQDLHDLNASEYLLDPIYEAGLAATVILGDKRNYETLSAIITHRQKVLATTKDLFTRSGLLTEASEAIDFKFYPYSLARMLMRAYSKYGMLFINSAFIDATNVTTIDEIVTKYNTDRIVEGR